MIRLGDTLYEFKNSDINEDEFVNKTTLLEMPVFVTTIIITIPLSSICYVTHIYLVLAIVFTCTTMETESLRSCSCHERRKKKTCGK